MNDGRFRISLCWAKTRHRHNTGYRGTLEGISTGRTCHCCGAKFLYWRDDRSIVLYTNNGGSWRNEIGGPGAGSEQDLLGGGGR